MGGGGAQGAGLSHGEEKEEEQRSGQQQAELTHGTGSFYDGGLGQNLHDPGPDRGRTAAVGVQVAQQLLDHQVRVLRLVAEGGTAGQARSRGASGSVRCHYRFLLTWMENMMIWKHWTAKLRPSHRPRLSRCLRTSRWRHSTAAVDLQRPAALRG